jgi:hypothetical protein
MMRHHQQQPSTYCAFGGLARKKLLQTLRPVGVEQTLALHLYALECNQAGEGGK